jgi:paraquat-inducible protein B
MPESDTQSGQIPESRTIVKKKTRLNLVWIIPIVAALIGAWVAVTTIMNQGPKITIVFRSAEGLEAGKTKIRFNGVDIGTIRSFRLTDDHQSVIATAEMAPKTENFLVDDTRFWVVSPRISGASVSGLGTLISGSYIGMEIGKSSKKKISFTALDAPPIVTTNVPGRFFVLKTKDLGSVNYGTPIYFRRLKVGEVVSYALDKDGRTLTVKVFVNAPYDQYVTPETRFWQASGIDVSLSATGVSVQTQSILSMMIGGLAFETPATGPVLPPAEANTEFTLYASRAEAYRPPPKNPQTYQLVFKQSVRGLAPGAPVDFLGVQIGQVDDVQAELDAKNVEFEIVVTVTVDPQRLGVKYRGTAAGTKESSAIRHQIVDRLTSRGLRAQLRTGSFLTGALYVALDFFPDAPPVKVDWTKSPPRIATVPGALEGIDASIASIVKKLDHVQYQEIGEDLRKTLAGVDQTLSGVDRTLSEIDQELPNTLREVNGVARSFRSLADYLDRHPEAFIKGKSPAKGE